MILAIGHRGARARAPENTLAAARLAHRLGADGWEFDVQPSRDGAFVLMHDFTLERRTDAARAYPERGPWRVIDFTMEEIRRLDAGGGEPVPTLEEALALTDQLDWWANVELKVPPGEDAQRLGRRLAEALPRSEGLLLSSFQFTGLAGARETRPDLRLGLLTALPVAEPLAMLERWQAQAWHPRLETLTAEAAGAVRAAGYDLNVWTVNEPEAIRRAAALDPSGIISDVPDVVLALLAELGAR